MSGQLVSSLSKLGTSSSILAFTTGVGPLTTNNQYDAAERVWKKLLIKLSKKVGICKF